MEATWRRFKSLNYRGGPLTKKTFPESFAQAAWTWRHEPERFSDLYGTSEQFLADHMQFFCDPTEELPPVITAWVPFVDAGPDSGCLEMLRLPEQDQRLLHHYIANISHPTNREVESSAQSTSIHPDHLPHGCTPVAVPAAAGDVILLSSLTPHRSTANTSGAVRWAADIRYQVPEAGNCFPQEASFLAASEQRPDDVVTDWREYVTRRHQHVVEKIRSGSSIERGTERNWRPARGEVFKDAAVRHPLEGEMEYVGRLRVIADEEYGAEKVDSRERFARL